MHTKEEEVAQADNRSCALRIEIGHRDAAASLQVQYISVQYDVL